MPRVAGTEGGDGRDGRDKRDRRLPEPSRALGAAGRGYFRRGPFVRGSTKPESHLRAAPLEPNELLQRLAEVATRLRARHR